MRAVNLYFLTQAEDEAAFSAYENILSMRREPKQIKIHEQNCLRRLAGHLSSAGVPLEAFDGFFFSYVIEHISKEFDLLKIAADRSQVLNIELKSQMTSLDRIRRQLVQNRYYLRHISGHIHSFTYVTETETLYTLDDKEDLIITDFPELAGICRDFGPCVTEDIDTLFSAADFLISPGTTPDKFLSRSYFLTTQQNDFKSRICERLSSSCGPLYLCLTGSPGTGKTLLLYDLAVTLSRAMRICILHCGTITENHHYLAGHMPHVDIRQTSDIESSSQLSGYDLILVDEAQRMTEEALACIREAVAKRRSACIFSCDHRQVLYAGEDRRRIADRIQEISAELYRLSDKIRANKELASFTLTLFDLTKRTYLYDYDCITLIYARDKKTAESFIPYFTAKGCVLINDLPEYSCPEAQSGDNVIGREFEHVLMLMDDRFYYDSEGNLQAADDPEGRKLYRELLFQGVSRARETLCLIVVDAPELFAALTSIRVRHG